MENCRLEELKEEHAKELAVLAHDTFKITYEDKFFGKSDLLNFKKYLQNAYTHAKIMGEIQDPNSKYFGVFEDEVMIAYLKVNFLGNQTVDRPDEHLEVERLYIVKEKQGKGLGRYMLNWISQWGIERSYEKLWLRAWEKNEGGIGFYKRMGMKIVGTAEYKFEDAADVDYVIEKDLC